MNVLYDQFSKNPEVCIQGSKLAYENAKRLLNCSKLLGKQEYFGPAATLAILGAEEAIKSYVLLFSALPIEGQEPLSLYFRNHKKKHNSIKSFQQFSAPIKFFLQCLMDWINNHKNDPPHVRSNPWPEITPLFKKWVREQKTNPNSKTQMESKWWEQTNQKKNEGLYVDFKNGEWEDPGNITSEQFEYSFNYTRSLLEYLENYHSIPSEFYTNSLPDLIDKMKEG